MSISHVLTLCFTFEKCIFQVKHFCLTKHREMIGKMKNEKFTNDHNHYELKDMQTDLDIRFRLIDLDFLHPSTTTFNFYTFKHTVQHATCHESFTHTNTRFFPPVYAAVLALYTPEYSTIFAVTHSLIIICQQALLVTLQRYITETFISFSIWRWLNSSAAVCVCFRVCVSVHVCMCAVGLLQLVLQNLLT